MRYKESFKPETDSLVLLASYAKYPLQKCEKYCQLFEEEGDTEDFDGKPLAWKILKEAKEVIAYMEAIVNSKDLKD
jgi:hypothetical protein